MRKKNNIVWLSFLSILSFPLISCNESDEITQKEFINQTFLDFTAGEPNSLVVNASDNYTNGDVFGCYWSKDNVIYNEGGMDFLLYDEDDTYYGAEIKTIGGDGLFQYGYFSTTMKPSNVYGTASTFFLYRDNPHDEIDIEFLGKDTTKVQFNYFTNGRGGHEYLYDLGFDASEDFHTYGFYWDLSKIIWYVDEVPVYQRSLDIPSHPMRIYTNLWNGNPDHLGIMGWMGKLDKTNLPAVTSYKNINYADMDGKGLDVIPGEDNSFHEEYAVSMYDLGFSTNSHYTVTKKEDSYDVTFVQEEGNYHYMAPNGYSSLKFGDAKYSSIKVKNLSDFPYDFCLSYYDNNNQHVGLDGEVESELNNSYLKKKGSTCLYFVLGAGDTATFKTLLSPGIKSFTKMNIMAAIDSNTTGSFSILDWFVYDVNPVDNNTEEDVEKISLMNQELTGNYTVNKQDNVFNVDFVQSPGKLYDLKVNNSSELSFTNPKYSVIKIKNLSDFAYEFTLTFKEENNSYMTTGGEVVSSSTNSTIYSKHGSTAEYFTISANDEAELKVTINESAKVFSLIEIIVEPKTEKELNGSFQILDWYIAQ